jgi:hypothetical protein
MTEEKIKDARIEIVRLKKLAVDYINQSKGVIFLVGDTVEELDLSLNLNELLSVIDLICEKEKEVADLTRASIKKDYKL